MNILIVNWFKICNELLCDAREFYDCGILVSILFENSQQKNMFMTLYFQVISAIPSYMTSPTC